MIRTNMYATQQDITNDRKYLGLTCSLSLIKLKQQATLLYLVFITKAKLLTRFVYR